MLGRAIARGWYWIFQHRLNTRGYFYGDSHLYPAGESFADRWREVEHVIDLRPTDRVLDVGCAEGLIPLEVAKHVAHVNGIDIDANRIDGAQKEAAKRGITNVSFSVASLMDCEVQPDAYDVVLCLSVIGRVKEGRPGTKELERLLPTVKRQIIVRANVQRQGVSVHPLVDYLNAMDRQGFDAICFFAPSGRGNLIVGNRRGTDATLRNAPPLILQPTAHLKDHPCLRGANIASPTERKR